MATNSYFLLILCLFAFISYSLQDPCTKVDCGQGKCVVDVLGLVSHCECNPGWKTIITGLMTIGPCVVPNCTVDFSCGGKYPPTPPPPSPINFTSPCNLVWCGDGDCVVNKTDHYCQCHERAANLFHNPKFVCFQQCYLDGDCAHLGLAQPPPPPSPSSAAPPRGETGSRENSSSWKTNTTGKNDASYSLSKLPVVLFSLFTIIFLSRT